MRKTIISIILLLLVLLVGCSSMIRDCRLGWSNKTHFCNQFHILEPKYLTGMPECTPEIIIIPKIFNTTTCAQNVTEIKVYIQNITEVEKLVYIEKDCKEECNRTLEIKYLIELNHLRGQMGLCLRSNESGYMEELQFNHSRCQDRAEKFDLFFEYIDENHIE